MLNTINNILPLNTLLKPFFVHTSTQLVHTLSIIVRQVCIKVHKISTNLNKLMKNIHEIDQLWLKLQIRDIWHNSS